MGNYVYKIKPSNTISVEGLGETLTVHCAEYAYKPYWLSTFTTPNPDATNNRLKFKTGVYACDNAWKRSGKRPEYVTLEDAESIKKAFRFDESYEGYGTGADVYLYNDRNPAGHFNDGGKIGWHVGWIYWSEHDNAFILQYRQLDALEDDPRREVA